MSDGNGLAEALLRLEGFRVLKVTETHAEVVIDVERTTVDLRAVVSVGPGPRPRTG